MRLVDQLLAAAVRWAERRPDVVGIALVGSYAKGTAREDSDVDLVVVVEKMAPYIENDAWLSEFGSLKALSDEDYGLVQSRRAVYARGLEVEWSLADRRWLRVPPDPLTAAVVKSGMRILYDPSGALAALRAADTAD